METAIAHYLVFTMALQESAKFRHICSLIQLSISKIILGRAFIYAETHSYIYIYDRERENFDIVYTINIILSNTINLTDFLLSGSTHILQDN